MSARSNTMTLYYIIAFAVVVIAFLLLGGTAWVKGMGHGGSMGMSTLHWGQILIGMGLGALLGWIAARRKW